MITTMTAPQTRAEWLDARKSYLGATDISAILGLNPWRSPLAVYHDKLNLMDDEEASFEMESGLIFEPAIAQLYAKVTGLTVQKADGPIYHPDKEWLAVNPDYEVVEVDPGYVECKRHDPMMKANYGPEGSDQVMDHEVVQAQWQMHLGVHKHCDVAVMFGVRRDDFCIYPLEYDPDLGLTLELAADRFWHDHILAQVPPDLSNLECDSDILKRIWPQAREKTIVYATEEIKDDCARLFALKRLVTEHEETMQEYVNRIQAFMQDAEKLDWGGPKLISWGNRQGSPRYKDVAEYMGATPEIIERFRGKPSRVFTTNYRKGD